MDKQEIIEILECCTQLDKDNFPSPNCKKCPAKNDSKKCFAKMSYDGLLYDVLIPLHKRLKSELGK